MELLLYLIGNACSTAAAVILLWFYYNPKKKSVQPGGGGMGAGAFDSGSAGGGGEGGGDIMISRDMQVLLFVGACARVYWSCSPPAVWSSEPTFIQILSKLDVFFTPLLWLAVVVMVGMKQRDYRNSPVWCSWPVLILAGGVVSAIGLAVLPSLEAHDTWPFADFFVIFNMVIEGFSMIPQMHLIAHSENRATSETGHFVGLLSIARVWRIIFWASLLVPQMWHGDMHSYYIWSFVIPDLIHTVIMGDYLYLWLKKVKRDQIDPMMESMHLHV